MARKEDLDEVEFLHERLKEGRDVVLAVKDLTVFRPSGEPIINNVKFFVKAGEILGVIGQSGAGKSIPFNEDIVTNKGLLPIGEIVETSIKDSSSVDVINGSLITHENPLGIKIPILDQKNHKMSMAMPTAFIKHVSPRKLLKVMTRTGRIVTTTADHNFFSIKGSRIVIMRGDQLRVGDVLPIPRHIPLLEECYELDLRGFFGNDDFFDNESLSSVIEEYHYNKEVLMKEKERLISLYKRDRSKNKVIKEDFTLSDGAVYNLLKNKNLSNRYPDPQNSHFPSINDLMATHNLKISKSHLRVLANQSSNIDNVFKLKNTTNAIKNPLRLSRALGYFIGIYLAEGYVDKYDRCIGISNGNKEIWSRLEEDVLDIFGLRVVFNKMDTRINNSTLARFIHKICGSGSSFKQVPDIAYASNYDFIRGLLRGYFDGDGWVDRRSICVGSNSKKLIHGISTLLAHFGVFSRLRSKKKQHVLMIEGSDVLRFSERIGFYLGYKRKKLETIVAMMRASKNYDLIDSFPIDNDLKDTLITSYSNLSRKERNRKNFNFIITNLRKNKNIGRRKLKKINRILENEDIKKLVDSDLVWDKITSIEDISPPSKYVYDISVSKNESFVGGFGNLILHNTTMIKAILNEQDLRFTGRIQMRGVDITKHRDKISSFFGYVPQDLSRVYQNMTAMENMFAFGRQYDLKDDVIKERAFKLLDNLDITDNQRNVLPIRRLSGGEQRRVSMAVGMIHQPDLLIMDEPTSGLDPVMRHVIWTYIEKLNRVYHTAFIVVTHFPEESEFCDKIAIFMKPKGFIEYGSPKDILKKLPNDGFVVDIVLEEFDDRAVTLLKSIPHVEHVLMKGERLRIFSDHPTKTVSIDAIKILTNNGIEIHKIEPKNDATMDDYFNLIAGKN